MGVSESKQELIVEQNSRSDSEIRKESLLFQRSFVAADLAKDYPSRLSHPCKKLVYNIACPKGCIHGGNIVTSRYKAIPLQNIFPTDHVTEFEMREDVFDYKENKDSTTMEWHVNFADPQLFVAYSGSLFAQDEMQVAEHPILGHLVECLHEINSKDDGATPATREAGKPTPILIRGIERRCYVATDSNAAQGRPRGLYGNNFASGGEVAVMKATSPIVPPTITNLIAMAALGGGSGAYSKQQIVDTYTTAFTAFSAARIESQLSVNEEKEGSNKCKVVIHTGNWGTGAFGGNKTLMSAIQIIAARFAGVDKLIYHSFNDEGTRGYHQGMKLYQKDLKDKNIVEILDHLESLQLKWGVSDGN